MLLFSSEAKNIDPYQKLYRKFKLRADTSDLTTIINIKLHGTAMVTWVLSSDGHKLLLQLFSQIILQFF